MKFLWNSFFAWVCAQNPGPPIERLAWVLAISSTVGDIGTLIWVDIPQESSLRQILNSQLRHMIHAASLIPNKLNGEVHGRNPSFAQVHTFTEEMMTNS